MESFCNYSFFSALIMAETTVVKVSLLSFFKPTIKTTHLPDTRTLFLEKAYARFVVVSIGKGGGREGLEHQVCR